MNNAIQFQAGKKYKGEFGVYKIIKRTKCFVTLSNGRKCKVVNNLGNEEAIFFKRNVSYWGAIFKEEEGIFASRTVED